MLDVAVLRRVRRGCVVQFRTDQPVHRIAFSKVWIGSLAKSAITASAGFFGLRLAVKAVHEGGFLPALGLSTHRTRRFGLKPIQRSSALCRELPEWSARSALRSDCATHCAR